MIYLIDDNQNNQRERLGINFVKEGVFNGYLTSIEKLDKRLSANDLTHLAFLKDAKCILLHASFEDYNNEKSMFLSGSQSNFRKIRDEIADFGDLIPLVLFSGGDVGELQYVNPRYISKIDKNVLYTNLWNFVEYYKQSGEIELRILSGGKNFQAKEISTLATKLLETLAFEKGTDIFNVANLSDEMPAFKTFLTFAYPDTDGADLLGDLESNPITINDFRNKINAITESFLNYGKNIRPWK